MNKYVWLVTFAMLTTPSMGRDLDGRYAQRNPEMHKWIEGLASKKGPCCSNADGVPLSDIDWETQNKPGSHYRVRVPNNDGTLEWYDVDDGAVITEPNRLGKTMVWPLHNIYGTSIRCFMPGALI